MHVPFLAIQLTLEYTPSTSSALYTVSEKEGAKSGTSTILTVRVVKADLEGSPPSFKFSKESIDKRV